MAADADLRGGMEEVEAGTDGLRVGAMRSIISNWRSRAAAAPPRSTGAPRSVPGFKVVCEACGGVPATCGRLTCPKCCYQASVCDKMCQRRWWRRHSTVCEVVVLPKAWTAAGGAEGLRHLVEPVLERVYELCDARSIAALGRAARWYLSASRPARRCEYGVSFAPYASAQTANVVVQPVGIARRGHPAAKRGLGLKRFLDLDHVITEPSAAASPSQRLRSAVSVATWSAYSPPSDVRLT